MDQPAQQPQLDATKQVQPGPQAAEEQQRQRMPQHEHAEGHREQEQQQQQQHLGEPRQQQQAEQQLEQHAAIEEQHAAIQEQHAAAEEQHAAAEEQHAAAEEQHAATEEQLAAVEEQHAATEEQLQASVQLQPLLEQEQQLPRDVYGFSLAGLTEQQLAARAACAAYEARRRAKWQVYADKQQLPEGAMLKRFCRKVRCRLCCCNACNASRSWQKVKLVDHLQDAQGAGQKHQARV
jgi:hypothetical protein